MKNYNDFTNKMLGKVTELCILNGARVSPLPYEDEIGHPFRAYCFCGCGFNEQFNIRSPYSIVINKNENFDYKNLMATVAKIDSAFSLPFNVERKNPLTIEDLEKRIEFSKNRIVDNYRYNIAEGTSVLDNKMPRAESYNWVYEVYGEENPTEPTNELDSSLTFRNLDNNRINLKEVLISTLVENERLKAESFAHHCVNQEVIENAYRDTLIDIKNIEDRAHTKNISSQKGE